MLAGHDDNSITPDGLFGILANEINADHSRLSPTSPQWVPCQRGGPVQNKTMSLITNNSGQGVARSLQSAQCLCFFLLCLSLLSERSCKIKIFRRRHEHRGQDSRDVRQYLFLSTEPTPTDHDRAQLKPRPQLTGLLTSALPQEIDQSSDTTRHAPQPSNTPHPPHRPRLPITLHITRLPTTHYPHHPVTPLCSPSAAAQWRARRSTINTTIAVFGKYRRPSELRRSELHVPQQTMHDRKNHDCEHLSMQLVFRPDISLVNHGTEKQGPWVLSVGAAYCCWRSFVENGAQQSGRSNAYTLPHCNDMDISAISGQITKACELHPLRFRCEMVIGDGGVIVNGCWIIFSK